MRLIASLSARCRRGVTGQIPLYAVADAIELTLDDALLRLAAGREQHFAVSRVEPLLGLRHR